MAGKYCKYMGAACAVFAVTLTVNGLTTGFGSAVTADAGDWPMARYDANRSSASPHGLPAELQLHWTRDYPPLKPAWPDQPKMQFDAVYEPVVKGHLMFVGSSRHDTLTALDTETGAEVWRFHADGPVRFAPLAWEDKVYFVSDDGYLYCLDASRGTLVWKFRGGPSDRKILGNERLISTWPARGAPVLVDGKIYFAAGIWPFMGIFIHALDAQTGKVVWTNDGDGSIYIKQPHNSDSFAGVAPQGNLVAIGDKLLIPGGRSVPACYDLRTGKLRYYQLAENGKRGGGSEVSAVGNLLINGGAAFDLSNEKYLGEFAPVSVLDDDVLYGCSKKECEAFDASTGAPRVVESVDRLGAKVKVSKWAMTELGAVEALGTTAMIKAGDRLYLAAPGRLSAFNLPLPSILTRSVSEDRPSLTLRASVGNAAPAWESKIEGTPATLLAADHKLFAVTREGRIYCFAAGKVEPRSYRLAEPVAEADDAWTATASKMLDAANAGQDGYCLAYGIGSGRLISEVARQSNLRVFVIDPDREKVQAFREQLLASQVPAEKVSVHAGEFATVNLPPYLASLTIAEAKDPNEGEPKALPFSLLEIQEMFECLRPYGGVLCLSIPADLRDAFKQQVAAAHLEGAQLREKGDFVLLSREGALRDAADWTHEHADASNTRVSKDKRVKAPLGILWFGGTSHDAILPRHGHGPQPQVIDGRLIIEGGDLLRAMDIYSGRILWETSLPGVGSFYDNTAHQPGANAGGTNYISMSDGIYVAYRKACLKLDPVTGRKQAEFKLPIMDDTKETPTWGYLNVFENYLVGGADPLFDATLKAPPKPGSDDDKPLSVVVKSPTEAVKTLTTILKKGDNDNFSSSKHLVVMDRQSGKVMWSVTAESGFRHNAIVIGGGRLYCIDRLSGAQIARMKRRGEEPETQPRLLVFDLASGTEIWRCEDDVFGTWLSYSRERDLLVEAGRVARDSLSDEARGMRVYHAGRGEVLWYDKTFNGPAMIHGDTILKDLSACELLTGKPKQRVDPITGQLVDWTWSRNYGCNTPAASEHLLTFRSGAAGYLDFCNDGGTGNFGGFRSSCTNNLIVAGGLLNAPDYTRTCTCSYQNQTSLALIHMPEAEMWTTFGGQDSKEPVRRLGLNLGAAGDRKAADGTLWLEYPSVGGKSPHVSVKLSPEKPEWFRRHTSQLDGDGLDWVGGSGAKGLSSLTLGLSKEAEELRTYTVRLYFYEPDGLAAGKRMFDVRLQGKRVLEEFDVSRETLGKHRTVMKEFQGIEVIETLEVKLIPSGRGMSPVLSGVEVLAED